MSYKLNINGQVREVKVEPGTPLLWAIRDELNLTGTKFGCGVASCGACTVHYNGAPVRSCQLPIESVGSAEITTIEGLDSPVAEAVKQAWQEKDVVQCGYCQSGQIMSAVGLLSTNSSPSDDDINTHMAGNLCRCATYARIKDAVKLASEKLEA